MNYGKKFEQLFYSEWKNSFPNGFVYRLPDQVGGFAGKGGSNPCDFLCYASGKLFMVECKTHAGASMPISNIGQLNYIKQYENLDGVFPGIMLWLYEKDIIMWVPIKTVEDIIADGEKSIGARHLNCTQYNLMAIPSKKKRVYLTPDYTSIIDFSK